MTDSAVTVSVCRSERESWDTIWKWAWFCRDVWWHSSQQEVEPRMESLFAVLDSLGVRSVLDCACGLGTKTVLIAKRGYDVEGADGSPVAAEYAPILAGDDGVSIRFLHTRNERLGQTCGRTYDCVYSDGFDEFATREELATSARGIHAVLDDGGIFVFSGTPPE